MLGTESARIIVCFHADIDIYDDRYERTWEEVVQNAATLSKKVSVSNRHPCFEDRDCDSPMAARLRSFFGLLII